MRAEKERNWSLEPQVLMEGGRTAGSTEAAGAEVRHSPVAGGAVGLGGSTGSCDSGPSWRPSTQATGREGRRRCFLDTQVRATERLSQRPWCGVHPGPRGRWRPSGQAGGRGRAGGLV